MLRIFRRNQTEEQKREGEQAQDVFEYLLIIGAVSVAVIAAIVLGAPSLMETVIADVTAAIGTVL